MSDSAKIIKQTIDQDPIGVHQAFADAISEKIREIVDNKKAEVAQQFLDINNQPDDHYEGNDDEDEYVDDNQDVETDEDAYFDSDTELDDLNDQDLGVDSQFEEEINSVIDAMIDEGFTDDEINQTIEQMIDEVYTPKSPDEKRFVDKHVAIKHKDANGNGDELFNGSNIKTIDRSKDHHGYNPGEDEKVYEEAQLSPIQQKKIAKVMREFDRGELEDSHGNTVKNKNQALAIAYSQAGVND